MVTGKFKSLQLYRVIKERNKLSTSFFSYLNLSFYISNLWIWITIELYKKKKEIAIFQHLLLSIPISLTKKFLFKYSVKYTDTHKYKIISSHDSPENSNKRHIEPMSTIGTVIKVSRQLRHVQSRLSVLCSKHFSVELVFRQRVY